MTRIRISRLDFMGTNEVTSLDVFMLDDNVKYLGGTSAVIPQHKFTFSYFENLDSHSTNSCLTDVIGVLISLTNLQGMKIACHHCIMRDFTLQNLSGNNVNITLWGEATTELNRNSDTIGIKDIPGVVIFIRVLFIPLVH